MSLSSTMDVHSSRHPLLSDLVTGSVAAGPPDAVTNGTSTVFGGRPVQPAHALPSAPSEGSAPALDDGKPSLIVDPPFQGTLTPITASQTAAGKRERERERRIMPARLRRVSNLLAGSTLEDELYGTNAKLEGDILPSTTRLLLTTVEQGDYRAYENPLLDQEDSYFSNADVARACRNRELIETPDFRTRDDTEMMGKTRTIRSEEDTSDAAYERRHRKPDNLEKKQRRLEKERLVRDRQKLKERIDQLRVADARLLMPILTAREQHQRESVGDGHASAETASPRGAEASFGLGKTNLSADATQTLGKLELLRTELLQEAHETLKRYDALLTPNDSATPAFARRVHDDGEGVQKPTRSISLSGAFANRKPGTNRSQLSPSVGAGAPSSSVKRANSRKRKSGSPSDASSKRLSLLSESPKEPLPFKPEDGSVRAENTYANIHARTSGGRFAPKAALSGKPGSTSKINTKGRWKAEGQEKPKRRRSSTSASTSKAGGKDAAGSISKSAGSDGTTGDGKPRRVKIILNKRGRGGLGESSGSTSSSSSLNTPVVEQASGGEAQEAEVEVEMDPVLPARAARAALTLEEAQALLAQAMEDDDEDGSE